MAKLLTGLFQEDNLSFNEKYDPDFEKEKIQFWNAIKLISCDDLSKFDELPKYQNHEGLNYTQYQKGVNRINQLKDEHKEILTDKKKLAELNSDDVKQYESFTVDIPASLFGVIKKVTLRQPLFANTTITVSQGDLENGVLKIRSKWRRNKVDVSYSCPLFIRHAQEIASLQNKFSRLSTKQLAAVKQIEESEFTYPVVFVSHRWETNEHPDPHRTQLGKLRQLKNCFIIYDFSSFPQYPLSKKQNQDLQLILKYMVKLIKNVIILDTPNYAERGWCIYEYISSSLRGSVVCDEIQDARFVTLRNWASTRVAFPKNPFRDSMESMQQNLVNEKVLLAVNEILPLYRTSLFTVEGDSIIVRSMLLNLLKSLLPSKKVHQMYLGEWKEVSWTDEELSAAFDKELTWEKQQTASKSQFDMKVPRTIAEAVERGYKINKDTIYKEWFQ
jgi:hypothetical protein